MYEFDKWPGSDSLNYSKLVSNSEGSPDKDDNERESASYIIISVKEATRRHKKKRVWKKKSKQMNE